MIVAKTNNIKGQKGKENGQNKKKKVAKAAKSAPVAKKSAPIKKATVPVPAAAAAKKSPSPVKMTMTIDPPTITIPAPPSLMNSFRMPSPAKKISVRSASKSPKKIATLSPKNKKVASLSPKKKVVTATVVKEFAAQAEPAKKRWYVPCIFPFPLSMCSFANITEPIRAILHPPTLWSQVLPVDGLSASRMRQQDT